MALVRRWEESGDMVFEGSLTEPNDAHYPFCFAKYNGYGCTMPEHSTDYPHLAGNGEDIVAIWWDHESNDNGMRG